MKKIMTVGTIVCLISATSLAGRFQDMPGKYLDIIEDGKPLVRYMYEFDDSSKEGKHETYKVYCHVMDENGVDTITKGPHGKFPHHRGLFIGWRHLKHGGGDHDLWHMKKDAVQLHREFLTKESDEDESMLSTRIEWLESDGETVCLEEKRTITVHHDDPDAYAVIDFKSELKAVNGDVELLGDPEHAGMQYRAAQDVAENKSASYTFHTDGFNPKKDLDPPWVAMTYKMKDGDRYTVQHMNHTDNPAGTKYSAYRDYGRFGAFLEETLEDGETLILKYRIRITKGAVPPRKKLDKQYKAFAF